MRYYRIAAKLLSPLLIQRQRQPSARESIEYLPGSTLRGALAAKFLLLRGGPDHKDFRSLFLEHPACFPNLLPADEKGETFSQVLPMTGISCKRNSGFKSEGKHGVKDILAVNAASRISDKPADDEFWKCPECGEDMKPFPGFWNGDCRFPRKFEVSSSYQRHTGIDRDTGTIAPSIFFMDQVTADFHKDDKSEEYYPQYLSGSMFIRDEQLEILKTLIEDSVFAGAERTRGLGELALSVEEMPYCEGDIDSWNEQFKKRLQLFTEEDVSANSYFSIKLESHAILTDKFLRPMSEIEEFSSPEFAQILKIVKPQVIRGWQSAWNMPKPDDMGVAMGSVFLFQYKGDKPEYFKILLKELVVKGIGLRREEGFGRISVCDNLHIIEEEI